MTVTTQLIRGECLEEMAKLPEQSIDLILCDLPYSITRNKWDTCIDLTRLWEQYKRICKGAIVLTAAQPFTSVLVCSNLKDFRYQWVWDKVNRYTGSLNARRMPLRRHEDVLVFRSTLYNEQIIMKPRVGGGGGGNFGTSCGTSRRVTVSKATVEPVPHHAHTILAFEAIGRHEPKGLHPTQKPVALMEYMVNTYTNPGMTVLDNCMGSGTTGVACINTGRNFIGIEQDQNYFDIATERVKAASSEALPEAA